ncbi:glycosyltransferase [Erwinia sp. E602]|uniref:glycosyltransferase n=1 Tax=Erwinia sp. E602 TaxID=2675378 RepID=UPI001BA9DBED|nr:glycosyltransferase [Erwinia sp. E602]QUG75104.1 glycosyltransferase [Erwinia sp. E602]
MIKDMVTVYIPTHNRPLMLKRAVDSVLNQTYENIEIIISDDGSQTDTELLVEKEYGNHSNIKYIRNQVSMGACHARNLAIQAANGEFITGLDDDDEFIPDRILSLVQFYKENQYSFISSGLVFRTKKKDIHAYSISKELVIEDNLDSNEIGNQIFIKTELLKSINGFDESLIAFQDYDCWIRILQKYGNGYNTGELSYIVHMEHEEGRISTSDRRLKGIQSFIEKHAKLLTKVNQKNLISSFYINGGKKIPLMDVFRCMTRKNASALLKTYIKYNLLGR